VLVPTRELANQVLAVVEPLAHSVGLKCTTIYGGVSQGKQVAALKSGADIVIACPGRLEDLIAQGHCKLDMVEVTVLDEADHMADLGFLPGVKRLMDRTPNEGQRLLFSATLDRGVDVLVKRYLDNPITHAVDPIDAPAPDMEHHVFTVTAADKSAVVIELGSSPQRGSRQLTCTAISRSQLAIEISQHSRTAAPVCSSQPISPPAAFTSMTSNSSCTLIRPPNTRLTRTVPVVLLVQAPPVLS
jgi:superfamily II DNA/RNA helicase